MATQTEALTATPAGTVARQEFGAQQLARQAEVAAAALAAQAQAAVQARYIMAMQRQRDMDDVRVKIMREIERPGFADVAWFRKPIGEGVEGLSVRFTDAAARIMGNLLEEAPVVYEDDRKRVVRVMVTDLESNLTKFRDATIEKTVERSSLNDGRVAISVRKNSKGRATYTVPATEDELLGKESAICSKVRRNLILQVLPGDIQDAAKARILEIRRGAVAKDPEGARRKIVDAFATVNVAPSDLKAYLGHDVATCGPSEIQDLRDLYSSIASGEATWAEALAEKRGPAPADDGATPPKTGVEGLKEKLRSAPPAPSEPPPPAREPGADDGEAPPPVACTHPDVRRPIAKGRAVVCPTCTLEVKE